MENKWLYVDVLILAGRWDGIGKRPDNLHQLTSEYCLLPAVLRDKWGLIQKESKSASREHIKHDLVSDNIIPKCEEDLA